MLRLLPRGGWSGWSGALTQVHTPLEGDDGDSETLATAVGETQRSSARVTARLVYGELAPQLVKMKVVGSILNLIFATSTFA